ncbi:hypothetical protein GNP94_04695 [Paenibacillus campinasensis]|uniref:GGDEF domain-containing protein n=1 Tax=Paenibacillus campinasensis TaxID=66347 RepID=A0ABW9SWE6_9BACL|nr:hypothetical protein [Paenibacillus campinasensis]MUG65304.1 hypothetical protein [Paenibacillus campinasensis]
MIEHHQLPIHQIRIGIYGTSTIVDRIMKVIASFPVFAPVPVVVSEEQEAPELTDRMQGEMEAMLLADPLAQRKLATGEWLPLPVYPVPVNEAGFYRALFAAERQGKLTGGISVDTMPEGVVRQVMQALDLSNVQAVIYAGPEREPGTSAPGERIADFHQAWYDSGACSVALTGIESVARELSKRGIPHERVLPSDQDIQMSLEQAMLSAVSRRNREGQMVVGMIRIDDFAAQALKRNNEHEVQKLKLDIHRMMLDYVESLDGCLSHLGGDEYMFFTTRSVFRRETGGYKAIPLAKAVNKTYGISLSIGIGFGHSASSAGTNARIALSKSKEAGGNACFIIREDRTLIGPLAMAEPERDALSFTDASFIKRAEEAGMASAYLSKLLHQRARFGKYEYKVHELAHLLGITVRSAHRLLQLWSDHDLVEISGIEKVPRGRPRQIFKFSFLE